MKRLLQITLAALLSVQLAGTMPAAAAEAYYNSIPTIDGEISRTVSYIYDGVTRTDFVLDTTSKYSNYGGQQRFSTIEFDPSQDDLYLEVMGGGNYISSLRTTSNTVAAYNTANASSGKHALVGTNGDLWLMNNYDVRVEGKESNYVGTYKNYEANVTIGYSVPMNHTMYGGEIICTARMEQEEPYSGLGWTFGVSADGEALFGQITTSITATNLSKSTTTTVHGINRIPANNAVVMFTDKGFYKNHSLNDAREVVIDCDYDYTVTSGSVITGKVTAITEPGGTKYNVKANRIILTARGDQLDALAGYSVGDTVSIKTAMTDLRGNTEKWQTVTDCVSGHFPHVIDGTPSVYGSDQNSNYPCTIVGKKANGNVVLLTSYGRQVSTYSEGLRIREMPELLTEMGIVDAFMLDGGGSATMVAETVTGGYELTGQPCDSGNTERTVINSIILALGPSKSGADSVDTAINADTADVVVREANNVTYTESDGSLTVTASDFKNPSFKFDLFGGVSADSYKYMVIEAVPTQSNGGTFTLGLYPSAGYTLDPVISTGQKLSFGCNGTVQRKLVELSSVSTWTGRMNYVRMDLFDDTGIGAVGDGISISRVKFFTDKASASAFVSGTYVYGDANGDGTLTLSDVTLILKKLAGWSVTVSSSADYNGDGALTLADAILALRAIAN